MNDIIYSRSKNISVLGYKLHLEDIVITYKEKLSFYQKYIILLLSKGYGIKAKDKTGLTNIISNILNMHTHCINSFLTTLQCKHYLKQDPVSQIFTLSQDFEYQIEDTTGDIYANIGEKNAECDDIIYIKEFNQLFLKDDFNKKYFRVDIDLKNSYESELKISDKIHITDQDGIIKDLIRRDFNGTDKQLRNSFTYNLVDNVKEYTYSFDVELEYGYDRENKVSTLIDIELESDIFSKELIREKLSELEVDKVLPNFIHLQEEVIPELTSKIVNIENNNEVVKNLKEKKELIDKDLDILVENNKKIDNRYKREMQTLTDELNFVNNKIHGLQFRNANNINVHLDEKDLHERKENIKKQISLIDANYRPMKGANDAQIAKINKDIDDIKKGIDSTSKINEQNIRTVQSIVDREEKTTHNTITKVLNKYNDFNCSFDNYVRIICLRLNAALDISAFKSKDLTVLQLKQIRELYQPVLSAILRTIFDQNVESVGKFFYNDFNVIEIQRCFSSRKISPSIVNYLIMFHRLESALAHYDNKDKKQVINKELIDEFRDKPIDEKEKILLSLPSLLESLNLSIAEKRKLNKTFETIDKIL